MQKNIPSEEPTSPSDEIKFFPGSFIPFPGRDVTLPGSYIKSSGVTFPPSGEGHHPSGRLYEPFRAVFSLSGMACFPSAGYHVPSAEGVRYHGRRLFQSTRSTYFLHP
ncbi:hypothetical protein FNH22_16845 [Fulvivirga sp. M361]|uniref:hypothetical protein n=1 Tax=Fulvivirga sp. M361 TaxID=2594266 RepID=UPI00117B1EC6|nr:hypothetical protein [Fulvivirga sp. M361]TRX56046.1 hypothetical protein FNH22_16845 [Fulvivirga sp. M361]